jgi:uncharacterized protein
MIIVPEHLQIVKNILRQIIPGQQVWAFGSRVQGHAQTFSDLDIAVISSQPLSLETMSKLRSAFSESNLPFTVDILDWASLSPEFQAIIEKEHEILSTR